MSDNLLKSQDYDVHFLQVFSYVTIDSNVY